MAIYKRSTEVKLGSGQAFETEDSPGSNVENSGIYRCLGCGREIASNAGTPFPPQNHHQHGPSQGSIRWRLSVYAEGNAK
jgi:hypothetical protein